MSTRITNIGFYFDLSKKLLTKRAVPLKTWTRLVSSTDKKSITCEPKKTCLYNVHVKNNAKLVDFSGFLMPIQYSNLSIVDSHLHTRSKASLFDVSHMLQTKIYGKDRIEFIESLTVCDVLNMKQNQSSLTLFTNSNGGIIDDLIVTKTEDYLYVVSNAGCIDKDKSLMDAQCAAFNSKGKDVKLEYIDDRALVALQGPAAAKALQTSASYNLSKQPFMTSNVDTLFGVENCRITRCGYTGEDGFEISIPANKAEHIVEHLLGSKDVDVELAGLGARDTLRLEAGLSLYGYDISENVTPVEAVLVWTIGKRRRELADFPGATRILQQIKEKASQKRLGLQALDNGPPARHDYAVLDASSIKSLGSVTSCWSPSLKKNICMAYVNSNSSRIGTRLAVQVRAKSYFYEVVKMTFMPTRYFV